MTTLGNHSFCTVILWMTMICSLLAQETTYNVRTWNPIKVGQKDLVSVEWKSKELMTTLEAGAAPINQRNILVKLEAERKVLAVDKKGEVSKADFMIKSVKVTTKGPETVYRQLVGMEVRVERVGNRFRYLVDGKAIFKEHASMRAGLKKSFEIRPSQPSVLTGPRKKGDTWKLSTAEAKELDVDDVSSALGKGAKIGESQSQQTLADVRVYLGTECLRLRTETSLVVNGAFVRNAAAPFKPKIVKVNSKTEYLVPTDKEVSIRGMQLSYSLSGNGDGEVSGELESVSWENEVQTKVTYKRLAQ